MGMGELFGISYQWLLIICLNFLFILLLLIMNIANRNAIKRLKAKYNKFMDGLSDQNMEQLLEFCLDKVGAVEEKNKEIEIHMNKLERNLINCMQKIGVVRFNAFDNVGSDLSFSIALLDNNDNGLVISGLYSRDSSFTYAKPVSGGKSKYALSAEEIKAIDIAIKSHRYSFSGGYPKDGSNDM